MINIPEAYFATIPLWAGIAILILIIAAPFLTQTLRGRAASFNSREEALLKRAQDTERMRDAALREALDREALARVALTVERRQSAEDYARLEADRDMGWDCGRGMEDLAHWYRHELVSVTARYNALLQRFRGYVAGEGRATAEGLLPQLKLIEDPPPVPLLRGVQKRKAE